MLESFFFTSLLKRAFIIRQIFYNKRGNLLKTIITFPDKTREAGPEFETLTLANQFIEQCLTRKFYKGRQIIFAKIDNETG
jgi:hypothetical protein